MATTKNQYTGDGTTSLFPFTFPYIEESDVVVKVDGVALTITTEYFFSNATTISINTPPTAGAVVLIERVTSADTLKSTFFPGSAIRARDLNDNFTQNLYVTQEASINSDYANEAARIATEAALQAQQDAQEAKEDAATAAVDAQEASDAVVDAAGDAAEAKVSSDEAKAAALAAQDAADQAALDAQTAVNAVDGILDAVEDGAVVSVNGQGGVVSLGIGDMTDVDTSSIGHTPEDGNALVWDETMGHWMPGDSASNIVDQGDFAYNPSFNTVSWPAGAWPNGINGEGFWSIANTAQDTIFDFRFNNTGGEPEQNRFYQLLKLNSSDNVIFNIKGVNYPFTVNVPASNLSTDVWSILFQGNFVVENDYSGDELRITSPSFTSNRAALSGPGVSTTPSGSEFKPVQDSGGFSYFEFETAPNSAFIQALSPLEQGDLIDLTWNNLGSLSTSTVPFKGFENPTVGLTRLVVESPLGTMGYGSYELVVVSPKIVNNIDPLHTGDILKYNSATQKWTASPSISISTLPTLP